MCNNLDKNLKSNGRKRSGGHISKWMKAASTVPLHFLRDARAIQIFFQKLKQWKNPLLDIWILKEKKKKNYPSMLVMPSTFESNVTFVRKKKKKISFLFNYFSLEGYAKLLHIRNVSRESMESGISEARRGEGGEV